MRVCWVIFLFFAIYILGSCILLCYTQHRWGFNLTAVSGSGHLPLRVEASPEVSYYKGKVVDYELRGKFTITEWAVKKITIGYSLLLLH